MLIFYCTDCDAVIIGDDLETIEQIIGKLDYHIAKCPPATFDFEATTDDAQRREAALRAVLNDAKLAGKIRLQ